MAFLPNCMPICAVASFIPPHPPNPPGLAPYPTGALGPVGANPARWCACPPCWGAYADPLAWLMCPGPEPMAPIAPPASPNDEPTGGDEYRAYPSASCDSRVEYGDDCDDRPGVWGGSGGGYAGCVGLGCCSGGGECVLVYGGTAMVRRRWQRGESEGGRRRRGVMSTSKDAAKYDAWPGQSGF